MTVLEYKTKNYNKAADYIHEAADILRTKAQKEDKYYTNIKQVRSACLKAYKGVLFALDAYFELKGIEENPYKRYPLSTDSLNYYLNTLKKLDTKLYNEFHAAYAALYLGGYLDGFNHYKILQSAFESAAAVINKIKPQGLSGLKIEK